MYPALHDGYCHLTGEFSYVKRLSELDSSTLCDGHVGTSRLLQEGEM